LIRHVTGAGLRRGLASLATAPREGIHKRVSPTARRLRLTRARGLRWPHGDHVLNGSSRQTVRIRKGVELVARVGRCQRATLIRVARAPPHGAPRRLGAATCRSARARYGAARCARIDRAPIAGIRFFGPGHASLSAQEAPPVFPFSRPGKPKRTRAGLTLYIMSQIGTCKGDKLLILLEKMTVQKITDDAAGLS